MLAAGHLDGLAEAGLGLLLIALCEQQLSSDPAELHGIASVAYLVNWFWAKVTYSPISSAPTSSG